MPHNLNLKFLRREVAYLQNWADETRETLTRLEAWLDEARNDLKKAEQEQ